MNVPLTFRDKHPFHPHNHALTSCTHHMPLSPPFTPQKAYLGAMTVAICEYFVEAHFIPNIKGLALLRLLGLAGMAFGEFFRKGALIQVLFFYFCILLFKFLRLLGPAGKWLSANLLARALSSTVRLRLCMCARSHTPACESVSVPCVCVRLCLCACTGVFGQALHLCAKMGGNGRLIMRHS